jgi:serine/threonine protein phosphatase PrpC
MHGGTSWMTSMGSVRVRVAMATDVGRRRHNEDAALFVELASGSQDLEQSHRLGARGALVSVCDGMGGAAAGEVASGLAVQVLRNEMLHAAAGASPHHVASALSDAIQSAGETIREDVRTHPQRRGMGTTCTAALIRKNELILAQVGDSRAYLFREGNLVQVTKDQSLARHLIERGHVSFAHRFVGSNVIMQALGCTADLAVDLSVVRPCRGDRLLLCSDGMTEKVDVRAIRDVLASEPDPQRASARLLELARHADTRDNTTVIVCDLDGHGLHLSAGEPVSCVSLEYAGGDDTRPMKPQRARPSGWHASCSSFGAWNRQLLAWALAAIFAFDGAAYGSYLWLHGGTQRQEEVSSATAVASPNLTGVAPLAGMDAPDASPADATVSAASELAQPALAPAPRGLRAPSKHVRRKQNKLMRKKPR